MVEIATKTARHGEMQRVSSGQELFPPATPAQQIRACLVSVRSALEIPGVLGIKVHEQKKAKLEALTDILEIAANSNECKNNETLAHKAVVVTSVLLGSAFIDEMTHTAGKNTFGRSSYGRELGIPTGSSPQTVIDMNFGRLPLLDKQHYMTREELDHLLEGWRAADGIVTVKTIDEFRDKFAQDPTARIIFEQPLQYTDIVKMLRVTRKNIPGQIVVPFRLTSQVGGMLVFRKHDALQYSYVGIYSELPRQEVWRASLEAGIPIYRDRKVTLVEKPQFAHVTPITIGERLQELVRFHAYDTMSPAESMEARKASLVAQLLLDADSQRQEILLERNKEFYRRSYGFEHAFFGPAEVTFTRSGVSAIEAAIGSLAWYTGDKKDRPKAYVLPGWYFENRYNVKRFFTET